MVDMDQPGIETRPIRLIAGASPFCETFFNDARAEKNEMLGELNASWTVGKRLLQHERAMLSGGMPGIDSAPAARKKSTGPKKAARPASGLAEMARPYVGDSDGRLADAALRDRIKTAIRTNISPRHVPAKMLTTPDIPYTLNMKKVELAVKKGIEGQSVLNKDALRNPEILDYFANLKELHEK